jgi:hypothetical protein
MASITTWTRLEPEIGPSAKGYDAASRNELLSIGQQARIYDPLWLLGRQWQFGEFQAEDAGSPIEAAVRVESSPITAYLPSMPEEGKRTVGQPYLRDSHTKAPVMPLEALVEREQVRVEGQRPSLRLAAEAGLHLARLLVDAGLGRYAATFVTACPLTPAAEDQLDPASAAFQRVVAGRAADGAAVQRQLRALNPPGSAGPLVLPQYLAFASAADRKRLAAVLLRWLAWYEEEVFSEPDGATPWISERMEYRFAVAAPPLPGQSEAVLVAPSYGGQLDWHTFDLLNAGRGTSLGATGVSETLPTARLIPMPVRYPGMPSSRFWEFEDARVDLGAVEVEAGDLARLLLLEFALVYGTDWFAVPLELMTGSLSRIASLEVFDTFGGRSLVSAASEGDPGQRSRLFRLVTSGTDTTSDALFLPPLIGPSLESIALEQVRFVRDETANLVWAIEQSVESATARPLDLRRTAAIPSASLNANGGPAEYRMMSEPPRNWLPLVPPDGSTPPPFKLTLGAVMRNGVAEVPLPQGRLVPPDLSLAAEEVPRDGLELTRFFRYARWVDGSTHLWGARRRRPAAGEASSAVQFDFLSSTS